MMAASSGRGVHSVMAGKTDDNIEELEILTYDGVRLRVGQNFIHGRGDSDRATQLRDSLKQIAAQYGDLIRQKFPSIPRRVSGYNLNYLLPENGFHVARALVGSEGTCVTVLEATCRLVESPPERVLLVVAYPDIFRCADQVPEIMAHKPIGLEGFDDLLVGYTRAKGINSEGLSLLPQGGGWLMVEFGASTASEAEAQARALMQTLSRTANPPNFRLFTDKEQTKRVWEVREASLGVTSHVPGEPLYWEGWEDAAVTPENLGSYLRDLRKLMSATKARFTDTSATPACTHASTSICSRKRESRTSASLSRRLPTSSSATAGRFPASTATVNPAPSCSPKCLVRS